MRLEQQRRQRRAERERIERREQRGKGDGQRELPVELPGDAADERHRDEDRRQPEGDGDDRRRDFVHRLIGRVARREALLDPALDVFDDDDGVIDHDADRQHQPEERQVVQREAEDRHHREGADQRNREWPAAARCAARQLCRKTSTTSATRPIASKSVFITSVMLSRTNVVVS